MRSNQPDALPLVPPSKGELIENHNIVLLSRCPVDFDRCASACPSGVLDLSKIEAGKLELRQWAVREAENGREALKRIQENKPDVILLDLMMPEMDGFAVVAALQK
ncbi:MAG: response regulator [Alphaproteobacteria bacterium]|nr:MAG: response regulator [Alphaproteobacteria bacterium]